MNTAKALGLVRDIVDETEGELGTMSVTRVAAQLASVKMLGKMKTGVVTVVVGVWSGCPDHVSAWARKEDGEKEAARLRRDYKIKPGEEAESEHAVEVFYNCPVRGE